MDVDFWGVVNGTKAFLPHVIASGDGHVVNISTLFGLIAIPGQSAYNAPNSPCAASPRRCARRC
jgi:NADP-dependent 3-hydroxy acid dehydrogenase YdfG